MSAHFVDILEPKNNFQIFIRTFIIMHILTSILIFL